MTFDHVPPGVFGLVATGCLVTAVAGWRLMRDAGVAIELEGDDQVVEPRRSLVSRFMRRLERGVTARMMDLLGEQRLAKARQTIDAAGRPGGMNVEQYAGRKGAVFLCFAFLAVVMALEGAWLAALPMLLLGWLGLDVWLSGVARRRQAQIERELPDFLDILAVCVGAGIAFRPALSRVADTRGGALGEEIRTTLHQLTLGASRRQAFEGLRDRNTSPSLGQFVSSLLQAEELGVPLTDAISDQARDMRRAAYQQARQRAQRAAPRIALVVTSVVLPGALLLIVAALFFSVSGKVHLGGVL